ncbi:Nucleotide-binding universal stress protein, UspA family [Rhizobiales bacterium GAS191]|jgi:nucleotide-binding universal stress UspA family protein|nr:Nucleotide-binding universal stress protein, UspA family [Rhizobiales bacterium GAS113]SEC11961.1 Nucleotide-binding universal stress protein, UspA family [Rhizobiales bacterium GAS191]SED08482.1 Nucleotide-binding universal stress protein, UspA family [Rhizobiales bacterium GAS188]
MFKNILVPVDIAEIDVAQPGLDKAVEIAKTSGAALRLIHVRSPVPYAMNEYVPAEYYDSDEKASLAALRTLAEKLDLPKGRVSISSPFGSVYDEVLKEAAEFTADLIVVGSHRPNWSTYLIGSNAANIVRHALCSVLVVRLPGARTPSL